MVNFKEIKCTSLLLLLKDKNKFDRWSSFCGREPKNIKRFSKIISYVAPKFKSISFNLTFMYLSEWFKNQKQLRQFSIIYLARLIVYLL